MGLKCETPLILLLIPSELKSDQNGIEINLIDYAEYLFGLLKSDQNGIEIITGSSSSRALS